MLSEGARRPVRTVAVIGILFVGLQVWWMLRARFLGAYDVDEAGGIGAAFRFRQALGQGLRPFASSIFGTRNGPIVPLLSIPALMFVQRSAVGAMVAQPVMIVMLLTRL